MGDQYGERTLMRVYIGETDHYDGKPLYSLLVEMMHREGIAGATVLRGIMGYGAKSHIHTVNILRLSVDLPMVVEVIDTQENIDRILPKIEQVTNGGLITFEKIQVLNRTSTEKK